MEVGAVKQAFNNEVILLKKKLNQAKIQVIHKLTRKAKTFAEKKAPEQLKEKLKRKAESAVNEVLIIKKIKAKDIAKFIVTHKGELKEYLNKPKVDEDKACARLLLHKALQDKYKLIRGRFSNVRIQDLFMSRLERRKMKKEEKEKQKNKKKGKNTKVVHSEGDWNVEDVDMNNTTVNDDEGNNSEGSDDANEDSEVDNESNDELEPDVGNASDSDNSVPKDGDNNDSEVDNEENSDEGSDIDDNIVAPKVKTTDIDNSKPKIVETKPIKINVKHTENIIKQVALPKEHKKNPGTKHKDANKNKNFNEKILQRKFKKDTDAPVIENKIVDSFFKTSTGENYMSVVEPRQPDEVKDVHQQGNRKLRRATMFGLVPRNNPRQNNYRQNKFDSQNGFGKANKFNNNDMEFNDDRRSNYNAGNDSFKEKKEEKLHPSWEAKRKKSGILPFEGKKIVFDDDS